MVKTYTCQSCGKTYIKNLDPDVYLEGNCFDCSFWLLKTEYHEDLAERRVVVDGNHYMISEVKNTYPQGFGGRQFIIQFFDGRIIKTNNLWSQGMIPDRFREMLPDNAVFLPIERQPNTASTYSGNIFNEGGKHV
ncbi:hypothetical protein [Desulfobacter curvatus]|uniref:hypothetical protein n=1 Tax=Desulfobacter curvatus TaxID=2290 RepID=UPI00036748AE|nr:hypothetical protein [Desulfobacter curvatus]